MALSAFVVIYAPRPKRSEFRNHPDLRTWTGGPGAAEQTCFANDAESVMEAIRFACSLVEKGFTITARECTGDIREDRLELVAAKKVDYLTNEYFILCIPKELEDVAKDTATKYHYGRGTLKV